MKREGYVPTYRKPRVILRSGRALRPIQTFSLPLTRAEKKKRDELESKDLQAMKKRRLARAKQVQQIEAATTHTPTAVRFFSVTCSCGWKVTRPTKRIALEAWREGHIDTL